jgi:hypothetical protein
MMAAPEARGYNLGWRLTRRLAAECGSLACSFAYSEAAGKLYDALKWRALDLTPVALRPRDPGAYVARALRSLLDGRIGTAAARPLARAVHAPARLFGAVVDRATWPRVPTGFLVDRVDTASAAFDDIWRRAKASAALGVAGVRDARFVDWRFFRDPTTKHVVLVARAGAEPRGYAAACVVTQRGLRYGKLMDLFCAPEDDAATRALLAAALRTLASLGAEVCITKGLHPAIRARLASHFPLRPRLPAAPARLQWLGDPALADRVYDAASWHATFADGDEDMSA